ncbi:hypothetical protein D3C81_2028900 [compost metagenome]
MQLPHGFPGAYHQQGIAQAQFFFHQLFLDGRLFTAQTDHVEVEAATKRQFEDALADQL